MFVRINADRAYESAVGRELSTVQNTNVLLEWADGGSHTFQNTTVAAVREAIANVLAGVNEDIESQL